MKKPKRLLAEYSDGWIDYPGVGRITDKQVANLVKQHTHLLDRLNFRKMVCAGLLAQNILMGVIEPPKKKKWYF